MFPRRPTGRKAFTLLELIVVIVVLGILAAIAVPTFKAVIDRSRMAAADETLHSLGREARALAAFEQQSPAVQLDEAAADLPLPSGMQLTVDEAAGRALLTTTSTSRMLTVGTAGQRDVVGPPSGSFYSTAVAADSPVARWSLGEPAGATTVSDSVGGLVATLGAGATTGGAGALVGSADTALVLNGTKGAGASAGDVFDFTGTAPFTVEAWVYPTVQDTTYRRIFSKEVFTDAAGNYSRSGWLLFAQGGAVGFERFNNGTASRAVTSVPLKTDEWSHVVGVYTGSRMQLYVNGVLATGPSTDVPATMTTPDTSGKLTLGGSSHNGEWVWAGRLDEAAIYSTGLTADRVAAHYRAGLVG